MTDDFDIMPPVAPGSAKEQKKTGFFSRIFGKHDEAAIPETISNNTTNIPKDGMFDNIVNNLEKELDNIPDSIPKDKDSLENLGHSGDIIIEDEDFKEDHMSNSINSQEKATNNLPATDEQTSQIKTIEDTGLDLASIREKLGLDTQTMDEENNLLSENDADISLNNNKIDIAADIDADFADDEEKSLPNQSSSFADDEEKSLPNQSSSFADDEEKSLPNQSSSFADDEEVENVKESYFASDNLPSFDQIVPSKESDTDDVKKGISTENIASIDNDNTESSNDDIPSPFPSEVDTQIVTKIESNENEKNEKESITNTNDSKLDNNDFSDIKTEDIVESDGKNDSDFTEEEISSPFALDSTQENDIVEESSDFTSEIKELNDTNSPVAANFVDEKDEKKELEITEKFPIPAIDCPESLPKDPRVEARAVNAVKRELNEIKKDANMLSKDVKNIVEEKTRKPLANELVLPDQRRINSILALREFATKAKFVTFKEYYMRNKELFAKWIITVSKEHENKESLMEKEMIEKVSALCEVYEHKVETLVARYSPLKNAQLIEYKNNVRLVKEQKKSLTHQATELRTLKHKILLAEKKYERLLGSLNADRKAFEVKKQKNLDEINAQHAAKEDMLAKKKDEFEKQKVKELEDIKAKKVATIESLMKKEEDQKEFYKKKHEEFALWQNKQRELLELHKKQFEDHKKVLEAKIAVKQTEFENYKKDTKQKISLLEIQAHDLKKHAQSEDDKSNKLSVKLGKEKIEFNDRQKLVEDRLKEQENRVMEKINRNEELLKTIETQKAELANLQQDVEKKGFKSYLNGRLSEIDQDDVPSTSDVNIGDSVSVATNKASAAFLNLKKIHNACTLAIEKGDFVLVKTMYNKLRTEYLYASLSPDEKTELYHKIRELYDDINLKLLEREAISHL